MNEIQLKSIPLQVKPIASRPNDLNLAGMCFYKRIHEWLSSKKILDFALGPRLTHKILRSILLKLLRRKNLSHRHSLSKKRKKNRVATKGELCIGEEFDHLLIRS